MIYEDISSNKFKSYLLIGVFLLVIVALGYAFGYFTGMPYFGLAVALVISLGMVLFNYYNGDKVILSMSKAREATQKEFPHYVNTVEGLAIAAGLPKPKAYVIEDETINAFATGRDPKHASIAVTTGALKKLNRQELEGVIAHEMSHIGNYDIRLMMLTAVLVGVTVLLGDFLLRSFIFGGRDDRGDLGIVGIVLVVAGVLLAILSPIIAQMIQLAISRKREYLADASGALLTRYPPGLANALKKIKNDNKEPMKSANKATAHLYISDPFGKKKKFMQNLFNTHPPIEDRIKRLEAM